MTDFLTGERGRAQFKRKLKWYADRYGDEPAVFAWELWNEMNAVQGPWHPWTQEMLPELQRLFPKNLAVQSLGSFDRDRAREQYRLLCDLVDNDVLQVHRYLDLGAPTAGLPWSGGRTGCRRRRGTPRASASRKPIILTETGAVKPRHTGASELYAKDKDGMLAPRHALRPVLRRCGRHGTRLVLAAGHRRTKPLASIPRASIRAVEGIDPPAEGFEPVRVDHPQLRVYALRGKTHTARVVPRSGMRLADRIGERGSATKTVRAPIGHRHPGMRSACHLSRGRRLRPVARPAVKCPAVRNHDPAAGFPPLAGCQSPPVEKPAMKTVSPHLDFAWALGDAHARAPRTSP